MNAALSWLSSHRSPVRMALLVLLVVAINGPWSFTSDGVPPPEYCDAPLVLVSSQRCARVLPGSEVMLYLWMIIGSIPTWFIPGEIGLRDIGINLLVGSVLSLFLLPFLSTVMVVSLPWSRGARRFDLIAWLLAATAALLIALTGTAQFAPRGLFWGIWLFFFTAALGVLLNAAVSWGKTEMAPG